MLTLHVLICFVALLAGAVVLIALRRGDHQSGWAAVLLVSTALISLTGFVLPSPPPSGPIPAILLSIFVCPRPETDGGTVKHNALASRVKVKKFLLLVIYR